MRRAGRRRILTALAGAAMLPLAMSAAAPAHPVISLWPEGVPGLRADAKPEELRDGRVYAVHTPTLTVYRPSADVANGTAVIVCPGGGYARLAVMHEGRQVGEWLASLGVTAFELHYRMSEYGQPAPLRDVLRAMRLVRSQAAEFGVRPDRIGVMGFSAGGHVASCASTLFDDPDGRTGARLDAVSARPDFAVLLYPVVSMRDPWAHAGSRENLLGKTPTEALVAKYSTDERVSASTPPTFLCAAEDDRSVPVENTLRYYRALHAAGVPAELHLYPHGGHGFGMKPDLGEVSTWPRRCEDWLRAGGWLAPARP